MFFRDVCYSCNTQISSASVPEVLTLLVTIEFYNNNNNVLIRTVVHQDTFNGEKKKKKFVQKRIQHGEWYNTTANCGIPVSPAVKHASITYLHICSMSARCPLSLQHTDSQYIAS